MLPAIFTTFLFSFSVLFASRSVQYVGGMPANVTRLTGAMVLLGIWAHGFGGGFGGAGLSWFLWSGLIGFGMGDMALFGALPRIGPRLAILLTQCLGAPIGGLAEYLILGTTPSVAELICGVVILGGVAIALAPEEQWAGNARRFRLGVCFGVVSALGQGMGGVFSRIGYQAVRDAGEHIDGGTAAYQRIVAGVLVTVLCWGLLRSFGGRQEEVKSAAVWKKAMPYIAGNAFSGPTLGVACFQWALLSNPTATVLPIVATSPLVTMGLAWFFQGNKPSRKAILGGVIAVLGASGLAWFRAR
ncbi:MAG: hypothetical protein RLZZ399_2492 [Verrucomicrobiota bacterium]|jgi:drug/metabolite transporter (DMT)-like permease